MNESNESWTPTESEINESFPSSPPSDDNDIWHVVRRDANELVGIEPELYSAIEKGILKYPKFKDAIVSRLASTFENDIMTVSGWTMLLTRVYEDSNLEEIAKIDLSVIKERDPACSNLANAFLFFKGYKCLQAHRVAHILWTTGKKAAAVAIQSRCSEVFCIDIHPGARIGRGLMIDHGTGIVIGETAVIGTNCSVLHGVTLVGSGKEKFDRHPKIGDDVLIGCHAIILGNIQIGNNCNIGAGSIVLRALPNNVIAVGNPARIVGKPKSSRSGTAMDVGLSDVDVPCGACFHESWSI